MCQNEPKFLVIDDDPMFLQLFALLLERRGIRVTTAESAAQALEQLELGRFDLVVSDCDMPEVTGPELRRALRMQRREDRTPVVFLTALDGVEELPRPLFHKTDDLGATADRLLELARPVPVDSGSVPFAAPRSRRGIGLGRVVLRLRAAMNAAVKRGLDIALSGVAILLAAPFALLLAAAIVLEDRGPVFYGQVRVGRGGRTFRMWKFRSMRRDADRLHAALVSDDGDEVRKKLRHDPRVTRIGRVLRRFSIDELPQLFNVLIGDMSLVGPRPPIPAEVARYDAAAWHRLDVRPGLTCIWQVSGRADVPFPEQVRMDSQYVLESSLKRDVELIAKTFPAVFNGRGAY